MTAARVTCRIAAIESSHPQALDRGELTRAVERELAVLLADGSAVPLAGTAVSVPGGAVAVPSPATAASAGSAIARHVHRQLLERRPLP